MVRPSCRAVATHEPRAPPAAHRPRRDGRRHRRMGRGAADGRTRRPARARWVARHRGRRRRTKSCSIDRRSGSFRGRVTHRDLATAHFPEPSDGSDAGASAKPGRALQSDSLLAASLGECDAAPPGGPRYASGAPPRQVWDPGHLGFDPVRRRLGLARRGRTRGRRRQAEGDRRDCLPGRERLEDVHLGPHPAPGRGRPPRPGRIGAVLPADPRRSRERSPSASCSTTQAACATSSSTRASTTTC